LQGMLGTLGTNNPVTRLPPRERPRGETGGTVAVLVQSVLVLEAVVGRRDSEALQLRQAEDVQPHLSPDT